MVEFATNQTDPQEPTEALGASVIADDLREQLHHFLHFLLPLLFVLDRFIDVRLVRTFAQTMETLLLFRNRARAAVMLAARFYPKVRFLVQNDNDGARVFQTGFPKTERLPRLAVKIGQFFGVSLHTLDRDIAGVEAGAAGGTPARWRIVFPPDTPTSDTPVLGN